MKFWEAMKCFDEGEKIRCPEWAKNEYWTLTLSDSNIWNDAFYRMKLCVLCDWELYKEPGLTFTQVIEGLKDGKRFRRRGWKNARNIRVCPYMKENGMNALIDHDDTMIGAILHLQDFEATDWEEVK